ncbi:MAG: hypothetical protein J6A15_08520 [Clostridia bacterium]|nr:hypothetical protein [Clostridia bacterium]
MEIKIDKRKVDNSNALYQNVEKVINGNETSIYNTTVYNINIEKGYEIITNKVNYNVFYKKYLNKFDELENYAYHLVFPNFNKKTYEFTSKPLILGKKIVDWIFGLSNFPDKELLEFYNIIKSEFDLSDDSTICKRWEANFAYFSGDLEKATNGYNELFDYAINCNDFPTWYLDDICIDGRNILHQYENSINRFSFKNKYQNKINENKHKLSYPDVDRIKSEIFDNLSKTIFDNKNKSKYTVIYGIGLEECFKQIQQLVYLTVFYGSITHMQLIRELIANIMYMYAITFEDEDFYKTTLKILFLSGEFKKYKSLYNKIKLGYNFVNDEDYINCLIEIRKSLFKFETDKNNIFLYEVYGKYIDDSLFNELTNNIYSIVNINKDYQINIVSDAFKSIGNNMLRNKRISDLLNILKLYFEKSYSRFYIDFGKIINEIKVEELSQTDFEIYQYIIDSLIKNKNHINYDISNCIIKIKQRNPKIEKYNELFENKGTTENILYNIEIDNNELEAIKNIVNIFKERHLEREKNPGVFKEYWNDYNIGVSIFEPEKYNDKVQDFILKEYLPLAKEIITSKNEVLYEKIRHIKLLAHLVMVEENEEILNDICLTIHNSLEISSQDNFWGFGNMRYKNKNDLIINVMMCDVIMDKITFDEALNNYIEMIINSTENIEEVLRCVEIINNYLKIKSIPIIEKQFILFNICYNVDDVDTRNKTIIMSDIFMDVDIYQEKILKILEKRVQNIDFEEFKGYLNLITKFDDKSIFNNIIKELKNNRNYYIKYFSNKYL